MSHDSHVTGSELHHDQIIRLQLLHTSQNNIGMVQYHETLYSSRVIVALLPRAVHVRKVIGLEIYIILYVCKKIRIFLNLSKYSLSIVHSNTGRLLFGLNRLQDTLAAPEVFVAFVSSPSGDRVSIIRNTNIDQIETTPLR